MRSFEQLCEDVRAFARAHPGATKASVSDHAAYGDGMDARIAVRKLAAVSDYARTEHGLTLYLRNDRDESVLPVPGG